MNQNMEDLIRLIALQKRHKERIQEEQMQKLGVNKIELDHDGRIKAITGKCKAKNMKKAMKE